MAEGFGSDFACVTDIDVNLSVVNGRRAVAESSARRLDTPPEHLFDDLDYGAGLGDLVGAIVTEEQVKNLAENEVVKDERIEDAVVDVDLVEYGEEGATPGNVGDMTIDVRLFDAEGPFSLTLSVVDGEVTLVALDSEA